MNFTDNVRVVASPGASKKIVWLMQSTASFVFAHCEKTEAAASKHSVARLREEDDKAHMLTDSRTLASEDTRDVLCPDVFRQPLVWKFAAEETLEAERATELTLQIGDAVDVISEVEGWCFSICRRTMKHGYFRREYIGPSPSKMAGLGTGIREPCCNAISRAVIRTHYDPNRCS